MKRDSQHVIWLKQRMTANRGHRSSTRHGQETSAAQLRFPDRARSAMSSSSSECTPRDDSPDALDAYMLALDASGAATAQAAAPPVLLDTKAAHDHYARAKRAGAAAGLI